MGGGYYEVALAAGQDPFAGLPAEVRETIDAMLKPLGSRGAESVQQLRFQLLALFRDRNEPTLAAAFPSANFRRRFGEVLIQAFRKRSLASSATLPCKRALYLLQARQMERLAAEALKTEEELERERCGPDARTAGGDDLYEESDMNEEQQWAAIGPINDVHVMDSLEQMSMASPSSQGSAVALKQPSMEVVVRTAEADRAVISHKKLHALKARRRTARARRAAATRGEEGAAVALGGVFGLALVLLFPSEGGELCALAALVYPGLCTLEAVVSGRGSELEQWLGHWAAAAFLGVVYAVAPSSAALSALVFLALLLLQLPHVRAGRLLFNALARRRQYTTPNPN